jgi:hypothetical protein
MLVNGSLSPGPVGEAVVLRSQSFNIHMHARFMNSKKTIYAVLVCSSAILWRYAATVLIVQELLLRMPFIHHTDTQRALHKSLRMFATPFISCAIVSALTSSHGNDQPVHIHLPVRLRRAAAR